MNWKQLGSTVGWGALIFALVTLGVGGIEDSITRNAPGLGFSVAMLVIALLVCVHLLRTRAK